MSKRRSSKSDFARREKSGDESINSSDCSQSLMLLDNRERHHCRNNHHTHSIDNDDVKRLRTLFSPKSSRRSSSHNQSATVLQSMSQLVLIFIRLIIFLLIILTIIFMIYRVFGSFRSKAKQSLWRRLSHSINDWFVAN